MSSIDNILSDEISIDSSQELHEAMSVVEKFNAESGEALSVSERNLLQITYSQIQGFMVDELDFYQDSELVKLVEDAIYQHLETHRQELPMPLRKTQILTLDIPEAYYLDNRELDLVVMFAATISESGKFLKNSLNNEVIKKHLDVDSEKEIKLQLHILAKLKKAFLEDFKNTTETENNEVFFFAEKSDYVTDALDVFQQIDKENECILLLTESMLKAAGDDEAIRPLVEKLARNFYKQLKGQIDI